MNEPTLQHWGIKGMKWGVRRYQNKDGTLTALGRKRMKEMDDNLKSTKKENDALKRENEPLRKSVQANRPKGVSEMSDAELRERVNRLNMEQQYKQYVSNLYPESKSAGQKFADKLLNDVIIPAAVEAGKNAAKNMMSNALESMIGEAVKKGNKNSNKKKEKKDDKDDD